MMLKEKGSPGLLGDEQKGFGSKVKTLIGGVALSTSVLLTGCGNGIPEENQAEYGMGKEVLISKSNGFEFYKWKPAGAPRGLYLVKYNLESQNDGNRLSENQPQKIGENNGLELYKWKADGSKHDLYVVKGKDGISTNWRESRRTGTTVVSRNYTVSYQNQGSTENHTSTSNSEKTIQTWLKLSNEEQESLGLPKSNNPRIKTLISLTNEQRENLGLTNEYNDLIASLHGI